MMHPYLCTPNLPSLQIPRYRSHLLSLWNPNPLGAIHGIDYFLRHPNRPVPSLMSPPHGMSNHLAIFLLLENVAVALLLEFVGGLGVHQGSLQVWRFVFLDLLSLLVALLALVQVLGLAVFFAVCLALFFLGLVGLVAFFVTLEASHGFSLLKLLHARRGVILRRLDLLFECTFL